MPRHEPGSEDRRGQARFEIVGQLWGWLETTQPLELRNLSRGGALVEASAPVPKKSVRRVRLRLQSHVSEVRVRVRHVTTISGPGGTDRYLIGVEFEGVPHSTLEQIDELVGRSGSPGSSSESNL